jgi:hypothetical protein
MIRCSLLIFIGLSVLIQASAQKSEIGVGFGTFNYTGDLARSYNFLNSKPAATVFYRSNASKITSFRVSMTGGKLGATDKRQTKDPFTAKRNASFNIFVYEASTVMEYHFLDWRSDKHMLRYTPYMFGGLALFGMAGAPNNGNRYSNIQGAVPFGIGFKYVINPNWYIAAEFGARKTFFDYLDNVSGGDPRFKNYRFGNPFDNDMYYFLGFSVTRTFYEIPCPTNPYK